MAGRPPGLVVLPHPLARGDQSAHFRYPARMRPREGGTTLGRVDFAPPAHRRLPGDCLLRPPARQGRGLSYRPTRTVRSIHGCLVRTQPCRHAPGVLQAEARLPAPPGADEPQHQRRPVRRHIHGRTEPPSRAPPIPVHAEASLTESATTGRRLLRCTASPVYTNDTLAVLRHHHPVPQHRRPAAPRSLPLSTRRNTPSRLTRHTRRP